jgi:hypothetical protein
LTTPMNTFAINTTDRDRVVLFLGLHEAFAASIKRKVNHFVVYMARHMRYFKEPIKRLAEWEKQFYGNQ